MNKHQWETCVEGTLEFNRLTTTEEVRRTEKYYLKCCDLLQEEEGEGVKAAKNRLEYYRNREDWGSTVEQLDAFCDVFVTGVQCVDCVSPSQLEWEYVSRFLEEPVNFCDGYRHTFLSPVVEAILEAELEDCDITKAIYEVNRSNMTKVPTLDLVMQHYGSEKELHESSVDMACWAAAKWIEEQKGDGTEVIWKIVVDKDNVERVVFYNKMTMKVMKPLFYEEPNLEDCL